jgi:hypothetical protein
MFPLKTLVVAVVLAIAFGPRVNACPMHNHEQTVQAPAVEQPADAATTATPSPNVNAPSASELASAEPSSKQPSPN